LQREDCFVTTLTLEVEGEDREGVLAKGLFTNTRLTSLNLSGDIHGCDEIAKAAKHRLTQLSCDCRFWQEVDDCLSKSFEFFSSLRSLSIKPSWRLTSRTDSASSSLSSCSSSPLASVASLFNALSSLSRLETLEIGLSLDQGFGRVFAETLPKFSWVKDLQLRGTQLGNTGIEALAETLPSTCVTSLNVSLCLFQSSGFVALISVLSKTKLIALDVSSNALTDQCASEFACLCDCPLLKRLSLMDTQLEAASASVLASVLPQTNLSKLNLRDNPRMFSEDIFEPFFAALQSSHIQTFYSPIESLTEEENDQFYLEMIAIAKEGGHLTKVVGYTHDPTNVEKLKWIEALMEKAGVWIVFRKNDGSPL
jgi:hypothetical protein